MGSSIVSAVALAAVAIQPALAAQTEKVWRASTNFSIPASDDRCIAVQRFQRNDETLRLGLEARPATDNFELLIEGPGDIGRKAWIEGKIRISGTKPEKDYSVIESSSRAGSIIYQSRVKRAELAAGGPDPKIEVIANSNSLELNSIELPAALAQLDACSSDLLVKWGYSMDFQRGVAEYPRPEKELSFYARSSDYPASAVRSGAMGETHALVSVDTNGRAINCRIIRSSGHENLDSASCDIVQKRVRFVTARAVDGTAIAAPVYLTMKWELPR
jgi:TonB family protein